MHRPGVTFRNPWEGKPLVFIAPSSVTGGVDVALKSRFGCKMDRDLEWTPEADGGVDYVVAELYSQLAQFTRGVSCASGFFHLPEASIPDGTASLATAVQ